MQTLKSETKHDNNELKLLQSTTQTLSRCAEAHFSSKPSSKHTGLSEGGVMLVMGYTVINNRPTTTGTYTCIVVVKPS